jgi:hypothetical protein
MTLFTVESMGISEVILPRHQAKILGAICLSIIGTERDACRASLYQPALGRSFSGAAEEDAASRSALPRRVPATEVAPGNCAGSIDPAWVILNQAA